MVRRQSWEGLCGVFGASLGSGVQTAMSATVFTMVFIHCDLVALYGPVALYVIKCTALVVKPYGDIGVRLHCPLQTAPSYSHALLYKHSSLRLHRGYTLLLYSYTKY